MWNFQFFRGDHKTAVQKNVDVDRSGSVPHRSFAAEFVLDFLDAMQQLLREEVCFKFGDEVQEPALLAQSDGFGFIETGDAQKLEIGAVQLCERGLQNCLAVANVRAEAEIYKVQNNSGWLPMPPNRRGTLKYSYAPSVAMRPRGERCRKPNWIR